MPQTPILILSDAPNTSSGLGKICRELADRINTMPEFRVGTAGVGRTSTFQLPYPNYILHGMTQEMVPFSLPQIWRDFAGDEKGILLSIWNPGWVRWLADPDSLIECELKTFLKSKPFKTWAYLPLDAEGPNHRLPLELANIVSKFDRILAYTSWAAQMVANTTGKPCEHLPHGTDTGIFFPSDRAEARKKFLSVVNKRKMQPLHKDIFLLGCVATNTPRKDWGLAFAVAKELQQRKITVALWAHTDARYKAWDLNSLQAEYGLEGAVMLTTTSLSDEEMADAFNACNIGLGIGNFEGWGLPLSEMLACGIPVVHGRGGGGPEFIPDTMLVDPVGYYNEGIYCHQRGCFRVEDWADRIMDVIEHTPECGHPRTSLLDPKFYWPNAWPKWSEWLRKGL